jgi:hypothetical protein
LEVVFCLHDKDVFLPCCSSESKAIRTGNNCAFLPTNRRILHQDHHPTCLLRGAEKLYQAMSLPKTRLIGEPDRTIPVGVALMLENHAANQCQGHLSCFAVSQKEYGMVASRFAKQHLVLSKALLLPVDRQGTRVVSH